VARARRRACRSPGAPASAYLPNFLFYANLPPYHLVAEAAHFWSLCVEVQFYASVALIVAVLGKRGPVPADRDLRRVTAHRVAAGAEIEIVTWHRVDEILAGAILALVYSGKLGQGASTVVSRSNVYVLAVLFAVSCHPASGFANYLRPVPRRDADRNDALQPARARRRDAAGSRFLRYIAAISFALYVFHFLLVHTWLGEGDKLARYLKRPLLFAATFALAHVSTFQYEHRWIEFGKRLSARYRRPRVGEVSD
jgi:peptidoglycan/LPS O-acetylase OafA/YrhL